MLVFMIVALFVMLVDTSGMMLDKKLTNLLYVVEEGAEEEEFEFPGEEYEEEEISEDVKEAREDIFGKSENSKPSREDVLNAINEIYGEDK